MVEGEIVIFEDGLKTLQGDTAFYFLNEGGKFEGAVSTHVDDFTLAGNDDVIKVILEDIRKCMNFSKVEGDNFRYIVL